MAKMSWAQRALSTALLLMQLTAVEGKMQTGTIELGEGSLWQFVGKFGYAIGEGAYSVRMKLHESASMAKHKDIYFNLFLDEEWDKMEAMSSCAERVSYARTRQSLFFNGVGEWQEISGTVLQNIRPHIWYFVVGDCRENFNDVTGLIDYEIHMTQPDGSEFGVEMYHMMAWNLLALACSSAFLAWYVRRCQDFARSAGDLHAVIWALSLAIALHYVGQVLHTLHLQSYRSNGRGIVSLDLCSEVFVMLSQVVQTALLIAIAMGYTLLPVQSCRIDVVKWIAVVSLAIHAVLVSFGKLQDESACKYHENEGAVGWVLLTVRILLFAWFWMAIQASQVQGGLRLHDFFQRFRIAGSLYFLAYPILFVIVQVFAPYLQHPILQIGLLVMQTASNVWLAELFLSRGTYFKVSALSSSLLPASGRNACMFDKAS
jgi:hypothetical protein